jgi:hypothetical protein
MSSSKRTKESISMTRILSPNAKLKSLLESTDLKYRNNYLRETEHPPLLTFSQKFEDTRSLIFKYNPTLLSQKERKSLKLIRTPLLVSVNFFQILMGKQISSQFDQKKTIHLMFLTTQSHTFHTTQIMSLQTL